MNPELKVGDKIRLLNDDCLDLFKAGDIFTVSKIGRETGYFCGRIYISKKTDKFEIVTEEPPTSLRDYGAKIPFINETGVLPTKLVKDTIEELSNQLHAPNLGGVKYDQDKIDFALMPIGPMTEVAKVWTFGKTKYSAWNWTKGFTWSRPYAAALRHIFAWAGGQKLDPETGISHLAHAICCLMMLIEFDETKTGENDLYYNLKQENKNADKK